MSKLCEKDQKISNNDTFMPVHAEKIWKVYGMMGTGNLFSVAHYYKQNGDMMKDPDMVFLEAEDLEGNVGYYPISFEQSNPFIYQESVVFEDGKFTGIRPKLQADHVSFANKWMKNIKQQQAI